MVVVFVCSVRAHKGGRADEDLEGGIGLGDGSLKPVLLGFAPDGFVGFVGGLLSGAFSISGNIIQDGYSLPIYRVLFAILYVEFAFTGSFVLGLAKNLG